VGGRHHLPAAFGRKIGLPFGVDVPVHKKDCRLAVGRPHAGGVSDHCFEQSTCNRRFESGLMVHSDPGGQYAGSEFRKLLGKRKIQQSMSRNDEPYDNVAM
jgi:transposase InsO family protein